MFQRTGEADFSAEPDDLLTDVPDDLLELIGAQMRHSLVEDRFVCTGFDEFLQELVNPGILDASGKLSVGERTCTAFTVLDVARRIQDPVLKEALYIHRTFFHGLSAFNDDGPEPTFSENQGSGHSGRTESRNDRSFIGYGFFQAVGVAETALDIPQVHVALFTAHLCQDGIDHRHFTVSCVNGFPFNFKVLHFGRQTVQLLCNIFCTGKMSRFAFDLVDPDHASSSIRLRKSSFISGVIPSFSSI